MGGAVLGVPICKSPPRSRTWSYVDADTLAMVLSQRTSLPSDGPSYATESMTLAIYWKRWQMTSNSEIMTRLTNDKRVNDPSDTLNGGIPDFLLRFYLSPAPPRATWENRRHCDDDYFSLDFLLLSWIIDYSVIGRSWLNKLTHWVYPFNIAWCIVEINIYTESESRGFYFGCLSVTCHILRTSAGFMKINNRKESVQKRGNCPIFPAFTLSLSIVAVI